MDFRIYARAKQEYDSTPMEKRPKNAIMDLVSEFVMGEKKQQILEATRREMAEQEEELRLRRSP